MDDGDLLHVAAALNDLEQTNILIQNGFNLNRLDKLCRSAMTVAVECGHIEIVRILLAAGAQVSHVTPVVSAPESRMRGATASPYVPMPCRHDEIEEACDDDVSVHPTAGPAQNVQLDGFSPPLHAAVEMNHEEIVELLLKVEELDVEEVYRGCTPLMIACLKGRRSIVKMLIDSGASVLEYVPYGFIGDDMFCSSLYYAISNGDPSIVHYLLQKGAQWSTNSPLQVLGHRIPLEMGFIETGSLVDVAIVCNQPEILSMLVDFHSSEIMVTSRYNALEWCCALQRKECLEVVLTRLFSQDYLLQLFPSHSQQRSLHLDQVLRNAMRKVSDHDEEVPLRILDWVAMSAFACAEDFFVTMQVAVLSGLFSCVRKMCELTSEGMFLSWDPEVRRAGGMDVCHAAMLEGKLEILKCLQQHRVIDVKSKESHDNLIFLSVRKQDGQYFSMMVDWLMEEGVNLQEENEMGRQPVHFSVLNRSSQELEVLAARGVNVSAASSHDGCTPLHILLRHFNSYGSMIVLTKLIELGADFEVCNHAGETPSACLVASYTSSCLQYNSAASMKILVELYEDVLIKLVEKLEGLLSPPHLRVSSRDWQHFQKLLKTRKKVHHLNRPPALRMLCWLKVREILTGVNFPQKLESLPIPEIVKEFLRTLLR